MSCEDLVCANCAGRVVDGGCPVCRASRAQLHCGRMAGFTPELVLLVGVLLAVLLALGLA